MHSHSDADIRCNIFLLQCKHEVFVYLLFRGGLETIWIPYTEECTAQALKAWKMQLQYNIRKLGKGWREPKV